ncbi:MAG: nitroreductase [Anaerofustis stercorihominis]|nr:nitroreductase [Anaerofustis stercorihominis]
MKFLELAKDRYSVRKFDTRPVEDEKIASILEAAKVAPTAANRQPQKIYVLKSEESRKKLAEVCTCTFDAPVIFVIAYDKDAAWQNRLMPGYCSGETDASIVCTHMMLQAWDEGIGSCWVGWFSSDQVKEALGLGENIVVSAILPVGYPAEDAAPGPMHLSYKDDEDMVEFM